MNYRLVKKYLLKQIKEIEENKNSLFIKSSIRAQAWNRSYVDIASSILSWLDNEVGLPDLVEYCHRNKKTHFERTEDTDERIECAKNAGASAVYQDILDVLNAIQNHNIY